MIGLGSVRGVVATALISICTLAVADDLKNQSFTIQSDATGIRSLKRTGDTYDTDYVAANASLGRLLIRFRSAPNGDWRELRDLIPAQRSADGALEYVLAVRKPTLASKA